MTSVSFGSRVSPHAVSRRYGRVPERDGAAYPGVSASCGIRRRVTLDRSTRNAEHAIWRLWQAPNGGAVQTQDHPAKHAAENAVCYRDHVVLLGSQPLDRPGPDFDVALPGGKGPAGG